MKDLKQYKSYMFLGGVFILLIFGIYTFQTYSMNAEEESIVKIVPHKALYDFQLNSSQSGSSMVGARGQMYFDWGDSCDAWTVNQHFSIEYNYSNKPSSRVNNRYMSWEGKKGDKFYFESNTDYGIQEELIKGDAIRDKDKGTGEITYSSPEGLSFDLPEGYYLPAAHTISLIEHALRGEKVFHSIMFDGTDKDGPVEVNGIILSEVEEDMLSWEENGDISLPLLKGKAWKVRLAFFLASAIEAEPLYEMTAVLHENGVISSVDIDYKSFSLTQNLIALEKIPSLECGL